MNWTKKDIKFLTPKEVSTSKQFRENRYSDISSIESLCREIELLARDSEVLEAQYKSMIQHYQSLAKQAVAT